MSRIGIIIALLACFTIVASAQLAGGPVRVSTAFLLGLVEHKTMPVYPDEAMKKGIHGDVIFDIDVDETGKITASKPLAGDPLLVAASKVALQTFSFRPYLLNGSAVKVRSQLGFHFSVEKNADGVNGHVECMTSIPSQP
jgi:outer membrane biosynthesis protein TonB